MLGEKYGIHPRPSEFILDLLEDIFGTGCTKKMNGYDLKIAPFDPSVDESCRHRGWNGSQLGFESWSFKSKEGKARDSNKRNRKKDMRLMVGRLMGLYFVHLFDDFVDMHASPSMRVLSDRTPCLMCFAGGTASEEKKAPICPSRAL
jgi:hypothetical protein